MLEIKKQELFGTNTLNFIKCAEFHIRSKEDEGMANSTIKNYVGVFKRLLEYLQQIKKHEDIKIVNEIDLRNYFMGMKEKYKDTVYNHHMTIIKDFYKHMQEREVLKTNPSKFLKRLKIRKDNKKEILSHREIKLILGSFQISKPSELRNLLMCMIFLDTGMRVNELVGLDIENINFPERKIIFYAKKVKREVDSYLTTPTLKVLQTYSEVVLKKRNKGALFVRMDNVNPFRPTEDRVSTSLVSRMLKLKGETLDIHINPHKFRHTFATNYIRNGGDQFSLKELLGHSSITSTDVYVNLAQHDLQRKHHQFNILNNFGGEVNG